jgi:hypothetical protein
MDLQRSKQNRLYVQFTSSHVLKRFSDEFKHAEYCILLKPPDLIDARSVHPKSGCLEALRSSIRGAASRVVLVNSVNRVRRRMRLRTEHDGCFRTFADCSPGTHACNATGSTVSPSVDFVMYGIQASRVAGLREPDLQFASLHRSQTECTFSTRLHLVTWLVTLMTYNVSGRWPAHARQASVPKKLPRLPTTN